MYRQIINRWIYFRLITLRLFRFVRIWLLIHFKQNFSIPGLKSERSGLPIQYSGPQEKVLFLSINDRFQSCHVRASSAHLIGILIALTYSEIKKNVTPKLFIKLF